MIAIIDYGMGNLRSVQKGFEKVGHQAVVTSDPAVVAPRPIRSFCRAWGPSRTPWPSSAAAGWSSRCWRPSTPASPSWASASGLQLLFDVGLRERPAPGPGRPAGRGGAVRSAAGFSVPHMGWNQLAIRRRPPVLAGLAEGTYVYFVHSYYVVPQDAGGHRHGDRLRRAVLLDDLARQRLRHAVPPREEPGRRAADFEELRRILA